MENSAQVQVPVKVVEFFLFNFWFCWPSLVVGVFLCVCFCFLCVFFFLHTAYQLSISKLRTKEDNQNIILQAWTSLHRVLKQNLLILNITQSVKLVGLIFMHKNPRYLDSKSIKQSSFSTVWNRYQGKREPGLPGPEIASVEGQSPTFPFVLLFSITAWKSHCPCSQLFQ